MKIFYKKDFEKLMEEFTDLVHEKHSLENEILELKKKNHSANSVIGGKAKYINMQNKKIEELINKVNELETKLKESMTDKYIVKKLKPGKTPNTIKTKISRPMSSSVAKFMKENFEE